MSNPVLRPLTFGEILDTAFNLYKRNFKTAVTVSAIVIIPLSVLAALATAGLAPTDSSALLDPDVGIEELIGYFGGFFGAIFVGSIPLYIGTVLVQASATRVFSETYRGRTLELSEAFRIGLRRSPAMLGLLFLSGLGTTVGVILCFLPGIWLYVLWSLSPPALMAEDLGPIKAMKRSMLLVKGYWWRSFGLLVVANLIIGVISSLVTSPLQLAISFGSAFGDDPTAVLGPNVLALTTFANGVVQAFTLPFVAAVVVAIYYDLRVRKEAYDLDSLFLELGEETTPSASAPDNGEDPFGLG